MPTKNTYLNPNGKPVILCKECAFYLEKKSVRICARSFGCVKPKPNGFCNYAIRKGKATGGKTGNGE